VLPEFDVRHGIGWGPTTVLSDAPRVEDGPGWWAAREAIGAVAGTSAPGALRTAYRRAPEGASGPEPAAINAALVSRDALLAAASPRSWGVLRGLLTGMSQREIADLEGISPSAVSQRVRRDGLDALVATDDLLGQIA
jgi:DNA-binding NarL/FixJ family response regulator